MVGFIAEVRDRDHRRRRLEQTFPEGSLSPRFDELLRVPLYGYQREGALFAAAAGRCVIGDEMGLGKTIQAIAARRSSELSEARKAVLQAGRWG